MELEVNGRSAPVEADPDEALLWVLRDDLRLTGTKGECGDATCGACTVVIDDVARPACAVTLSEALGRSVATVEGLAGDEGALHPLQQAFIDHGAVLCGWCTPGQLMRAHALLLRSPSPSAEEIVEALEPVLCRCGNYAQARAAVAAASGRAGGSSSEGGQR